jgi:hypothetical protein
MNHRFSTLVRTAVPAAAFLALLGVPSSAQTIVGGSTWLTAADAAQLATWLNQGPVTFTRIFEHVANDGKTSTDFHAAADGKGPTISVYSAAPVQTTAWNVIGGYNPQSWNSVSGYNITSNAADRTAFIFNLTTGLVQGQKLVNPGEYQTYNQSTAGPTFGSGHDLYSHSSLNTGYVYGHSYGSTNLISTGITQVQYRGLEVFTISVDTSADVPEPGAWALLAGTGALGGLMVLRRRKR